MRDRAYLDLSQRSISGTVAYLLIWGVVAVFFWGDFPRGEAFWFIGPLIVLTMGFRVLSTLSFKPLYMSHRRVWKVIYFSGVFLAVAIWDHILFMVLDVPGYASLKTGFLIATAGLCAGGVSSFAPDRRLGLLYPSALLVPTYIVLVTSEHGDAFVASLLSVFFVFLIMINFRQNREYRRGLRNQIELEQRQGELELLHVTDALTQVYNRNYFDEVLERELGRLDRECTNLALLLLDIDHFKEVNDTYGHPCGDEVLRQLAAVIQERLRRVNDSVARYGGEEFAVLLPATELEGALAVAEGIRNAVENHRFLCGSREIDLSVSVGVACANRPEEKGQLGLLARSDVALYAAKNSGRNRVEAWVDEELEIPIMED